MARQGHVGVDSLEPVLDSFTTFGEFLRFLRRRAQMTQQELAIAVGYSEAQISRLEKNQRPPETARLAALFVPALRLEGEPELVARMLALAVIARGEPLEIAPPAPPSALPKSNLPAPLSSFIGREREVAGVRQKVLQGRLVTITGAGGVGKTRLALRAAEELAGAFPGGVWWVELAQVIDPVFVPIAVASVFNQQSAPGQRLIETLRAFFAQKRLLLILDNCEHVIDAVAQMSASLLEQCPNLHILATSREILNVEGEVFFRCPSLTLPDLVADHPSLLVMKQVEASEAVRLFLDRAAVASPGFCLAGKNCAAIVEICKRLDGIPLAIELAAARLRLLSLEQISAHMQDVFGLLSSSSRVAQPRHKTLRALIDWSYQLLSPGEQILLRRLSVFTGGWTLPAAESVATGEGLASGEVLNRMQQLVDKSLIFTEPTELEENRFRMLETIRQYAREKLEEAGELDVIRGRHLEYFSRMAVQAVSAGSHEYIQSLSELRLMRELDNIRQALEWALRVNVEAGMRLGIAFSQAVPFNLLPEFRNWLEQLIEADAALQPSAGTRRPDDAYQLLRGEALLRIGEIYYIWGLQGQSEQVLLESLKIFDSLGEQADYLRAVGQMHLGALLICTDPEQSRLNLEASRAAILRMGQYTSLPSLDRKLAILNIYAGDLPSARRYAEEDLQVSIETHAQATMAYEWAGIAAHLMGDFDQAIRYFQLGQAEGWQHENHSITSYQEYLEGFAAFAQGNASAARRIAQQLIAHGEQTGDSSWFLNADILLGMLEWTQGAYDEAERRCLESLSRHYAQYHSYTAPLVYVLGRVALARRNLVEAETRFRRLDELTDAPALVLWKAHSLHAFGLLAAARPEMAERAAVLLGAQAHLFAWLQMLLSPREQEDLARSKNAVREILGDEAFAAAWARGQGLAHRQAFSLALQP